MNYFGPFVTARKKVVERPPESPFVHPLRWIADCYWNSRRQVHENAYVQADKITEGMSPDAILDAWRHAHGTLPILDRELETRDYPHDWRFRNEIQAASRQRSIGERNGPRDWATWTWRLRLYLRLKMLGGFRWLGF